jgi:hypothetical protein
MRARMAALACGTVCAVVVSLSGIALLVGAGSAAASVSCSATAFHVPAGVSAVTITAVGATGSTGMPGLGGGNPGGVGGLGAKVVARQVPVVPGATLWYGANSDVLPGGLGGHNYANVVGGHGGNGSFVATAQPTLTDEGASCALPAGALLVVAAGGGGGGGGDTGGPGGAGGAADGGVGGPGGNKGATAGAGGGAGTDVAGGAAGA